MRSVDGSVMRQLRRDPPVACLSSYPPRACGIATFTADLAAVLDTQSPHATKIIVMDEPGVDHQYGLNVHWHIKQDDPTSYVEVAAAVAGSNVDIINIQKRRCLCEGEPFKGPSRVAGRFQCGMNPQ